MSQTFTTVFEVSRYSIDALLWPVGCLAGCGYFVLFRRPKRDSRIVEKAIFFAVIPTLMFVGGCMLLGMLGDGQRYTEALRTGHCSLVQGIVKVLHEQPNGGHSDGDIIDVGDKQFDVNYFSYGVGYKQTISHGGCLTNGVMARLYYIGNTILKVEIQQPNN